MYSFSLNSVVTGCPRNAEITIQSPTTLNISWSPPLTAETDGNISHYIVNCSGSGVSHFNYTETENIEMVGLRPYSHYSCCISANTSVNVGTAVCNSTVTAEAGMQTKILMCSHHSYYQCTCFPPKHPPLLPRVWEALQLAPPHCLSTGVPHLHNTGMEGFDTTKSV